MPTWTRSDKVIAVVFIALVPVVIALSILIVAAQSG